MDGQFGGKPWHTVGTTAYSLQPTAYLLPCRADPASQRLAHDVLRPGLAGEVLELQRRLADEHVDAGDRVAFFLAGLFDQQRLLGLYTVSNTIMERRRYSPSNGLSSTCGCMPTGVQLTTISAF